MPRYLTEPELERLTRFRVAYAMTGDLQPFRGLGWRGAARLLWLRWLVEHTDHLDDDAPPSSDEPCTARWARRFFAPLDAVWGQQLLP